MNIKYVLACTACQIPVTVALAIVIHPLWLALVLSIMFGGGIGYLGGTIQSCFDTSDFEKIFDPGETYDSSLLREWKR